MLSYVVPALEQNTLGTFIEGNTKTMSSMVPIFLG